MDSAFSPHLENRAISAPDGGCLNCDSLKIHKFGSLTIHESGVAKVSGEIARCEENQDIPFFDVAALREMIEKNPKLTNMVAAGCPRILWAFVCMCQDN